MAESAYVFQRVDDQRELERLRMIERVFDPASRRRLLATGLQAGWRCLEVGPGAGSIMTSQVVEKARQHRSHIAQRLNVPKRTPRLFARCGLAGRDFEQPAGFTGTVHDLIQPYGSSCQNGFSTLCWA
jgi:hypothetical protein